MHILLFLITKIKLFNFINKLFFLHIIDNFLSSSTDNLLDDFNFSDDNYYIYNNCFEKKKALKTLPDNSRKVLDFLNSENFLEKLKNLTGIINLEIDPTFHGSGLHLYENGSFLTKHLDYSINPNTGKQRRLNIILYLNDWDEAWGGALELYDIESKKITQKIYPKKNRAVIFETNDFSLHGVEKINCPPNIQRQILTCFYVSEPEKNVTVRHKALFFPEDQSLNELALKRSVQLLQ